MSFDSSVPMDISYGTSSWGSNPSAAPATYLTGSLTSNYEICNPDEPLVDDEPEDDGNLRDYITPPGAPCKFFFPDSASSSSSTSSSFIRQLQRSQSEKTQCYDQLRRLGNGGNGNCFLVHHRFNNVLRVCKVTRSEPDLMDSKPLEAEILTSILPPHERIVRMHELIVTPYTAEMYFDYYSGGDLDQLMRCYFEEGMILTENFIWHCYRQLSEALAYIHTGYDAVKQRFEAPPRGHKSWTPIIHADIKPLNIFVKPSPDGSFPSLVLGDFGNSELRPGRALLGTVSWMPPEVPEYSVQSDVWGLGAVIHALCHQGRPPMRPFPAHWAPTSTNLEIWDLMSSARQCEPVGPEYTPALNQVLEINMRRKPADRPSSKELSDGLNEHVMYRRRHYSFGDWCTIGAVPCAGFTADHVVEKHLGLERPEEGLFSYTHSQFESRDDAGPVDRGLKVRNMTESLDDPEVKALPPLFPANDPPFLHKPNNRPRYLGSLPDRDPYWLQDADGNWYTGNEPIQQPNNEMNIQPDDYMDNEPSHHAVSVNEPSSLNIRRAAKVVIIRAVKTTLRWLLWLSIPSFAV